MIGDILFYKSVNEQLPDEIIKLYELFTSKNKDPYVHCAIDVGNGNKVEALFKGVVMSPIGTRPYSLYQPKELLHLKEAMFWLSKMIGSPYGWGDIADVILQHPVIEQHYDCSDLCASFLYQANDIHKEEFLKNDKALITPEQLSEILGVK